MMCNSRRYLSFEAKIVRIEAHHSKQLKCKTISMVKKVWDDKSSDVTWEIEEIVRETYPYLFFVKSTLKEEIFFLLGRI